MIRRLFSDDNELLVPIADRLRYIQWFRLGLVTIAFGYALFLPVYRPMAPSTLIAVSLGYCALSALNVKVWRLNRDRAVTLHGIMILIDGVFLAIVSYSPVEVLSPYRYMIIMHVVMVTLLASFRTGLKIATWHTLLLWLDYQLRGAGVLAAIPVSTSLVHRASFQLAIFTAVLWLAAMTTAAFAAVNERELRRHGYDMGALAQLAWQLENDNRPETAGRTVVKAITDEFDLPRVVLAAAREGGRFSVLASAGQVGASPADPEHDEIVALALAERRTFLIVETDQERDPWLSATFPDARNIGLVPMHAEGRPIGVVCFEYGARHGSRIEHRLVSMVERFVSQSSLAVANAFLLERLSELAETDGLTGAANRRALENRLNTEIVLAQREQRKLSLIMFDVDFFKQINDQYGHTVGDEVLCRLVQVARRACRTDDLVARYGGEEFAVVLPRADGPVAVRIAERIRTEVCADDAPVPVTVSLGVASWTHGTSQRALITEADAALYQSKRLGRNRTTLHDAGQVTFGDRPDPIATGSE